MEKPLPYRQGAYLHRHDLTVVSFGSILVSSTISLLQIGQEGLSSNARSTLIQHVHEASEHFHTGVSNKGNGLEFRGNPFSI
jgi:hypothetical protein